jgi:branched-chain amino acid aminotransferase
MTKVSLDWSSLGFGYMPISKRYVATYKDGKWGPGALTDDPTNALESFNIASRSLKD